MTGNQRFDMVFGRFHLEIFGFMMMNHSRFWGLQHLAYPQKLATFMMFVGKNSMPNH